MVSNSTFDMGRVIYEEFVSQSNINKVNLSDQLATVTFVKSVRPIEGYDHLEEIIVNQIGVKNIDVRWMLEDGGVPKDLFDSELMLKPKDYENLCAERYPLLYRKIACQAIRKIVRVKTKF